MQQDCVSSEENREVADLEFKKFILKAGRYQGRYSTKQDGTVYTLVVMLDDNGFERVCNGFKGKHYASRKNAERAVARYIERVK